MPDQDSDPCQAQEVRLANANQELRDFEGSFVPGEMTTADEKKLERLRKKARTARNQLTACREIHGEAAEAPSTSDCEVQTATKTAK
jgi:hypothetical protein